MQEYIRDLKMAGRFYKSSNCYNREKDERFRISDHRTINRITHASKIMLRLRIKRLENNAKYYIRKTQFGFRKRCEMREVISVMRLQCERRLEFDEELFICFMDFKNLLIEKSGQSFSKYSKRSE